ncbi:helix-turn-helix domain-containing protein [Pengzhenrongella frigida]|uniref:XRE family transcriptional regulator n=1 Tax=Pengzhenrongella frigida TaxID=1259133 RepID=A0A4Q5N2X5_9MICO|nr:helix-turn-helix transcriptional regulator [Cellulomonas sp. HLT2-17]RYV52552.1 XRE family transcriptional regulator [Cellulomonas sp. HLT2-17]
MTDIGDRIRVLRVAASLSQTALAGESFSPSYISLIEGGRREPTDSALAVLAARLDTTAEYLRHGESGPNEARARLEIDYAKLASENGHPEESRDRMLALDLTGIAPALHPEILKTLARAHEGLGDLEASIAVLEPLLERVRAHENHLDAAEITTSLVISYLQSGDLHRSVELGEEVLADLESAGLTGTDEHLRLGASILWAYVERGDLMYATHRASELIAQADALGTPRGRGGVYWNASLVAEGRHDYALAQRYTTRALALVGETGSTRDVARLRHHYAWLLLRGEPAAPEAALVQFQLSVPVLAVVGSSDDIAFAEIERSRAYLMLGDVAKAEDDARSAIERLGSKPRLDTWRAHLVLGDALLARGDDIGAADAYLRAADMLGMMAASRQSAAAWRELGDRYLAQGDVSGAARSFDRALREAGLRPTVPAAMLAARYKVTVD